MSSRVIYYGDLCLLCVFSASDQYTFLLSDDTKASQRSLCSSGFGVHNDITCEDANNGY